MDAVGLLRRTPHDFHPAAKGEPWGLQGPTLERLAALTPAGGNTLETGLGESTVVFLAASARHIAVAPDAEEKEAIVSFCNEHGVPTTGLDFRQGVSERILPPLDLPPLDLVLIDGQHAFPIPFLDWYFTADYLRKGGVVVVDDTGIRTGKVLCEFLDAEPEWQFREGVGRAKIFEKLVDGPVTRKWWGQQPWCKPDPPPGRTWDELRSRVRLRTRLKSLLGKS